MKTTKNNVRISKSTDAVESGISGCIPLLQEPKQESTWWNAGQDSSCM